MIFIVSSFFLLLDTLYDIISLHIRKSDNYKEIVNLKIFLLQIIKKNKLAKISASFIKWCALALLTGSAVGITASFFHLALKGAAESRQRYPLIILALPVCGLLIAALYNLMGCIHDKGTNMVITAVRDGTKITWRNTVSIFAGSVLTHIGGGSAGREGAALQIGGSVGSQIGLWLKLSSKDCRILTMCGMSAGFAALFGTPAAATFFSMEVISIGIMHYSALVPCTISALTGIAISSRFGVSAEKHSIIFDAADHTEYLGILLITVCCALLSIVFCYSIKITSRLYKKYIKNPYLRIAAGGAAVVILTFVCHTYDYNGTGAEIINRSFTHAASLEKFALKLLFTALTLGAGYKGGEIMPVFYIGSSFGSAISPILGLDCSVGAAVGMSALFCGVTNCPIAAVLLCIELFGAEHIPVYLLSCGLSYMLSGYAGLYSEQKILYSKLSPEYINRKIGENLE